jgi:NADH-quinone oxidoreductase subunit L
LLHAAFLLILLPLVGFGLLVVGGRRLGNPWAGWLGTAAVTASFVVAIIVTIGLFERAPDARSYTQNLFTWIPVGGLQVKMAILIDPLSVVMALFVTGVSALIHMYSIGYMEKDENFSRFFVYMNLFVLSMLVLVLSDNFLFNFLGWEGVGLCSYLLIAFWFERDSAASAGKKAFIYNRIGDFGFLIAMFLIFATVGTLSYSGLFSNLGHVSSGTATAIALLLFLGAVGKSAQIPLFPWLLDAMEGPTPVSALIHAATMVTAGVYLMVRVSPLLAHAGAALDVIAIFGAVTAFIAAAAACAQHDIKKVLAYSTVSQLGYMFLAVGCRAYVAAIFLMISHAFYKGLLFLGAGSVIHGMHDEQDLRRMGNLRRFMPITFATFFVAWFAIAGVPPLSGFWAKGDVLFNAFARSPALWAVGAVTAVLTAYYLGREFFLVFYGPERWRQAAQPVGAGSASAEHPAGSGSAPPVGEPHEAPWVMWIPLVILAVLSIIDGLIDLPFHPNADFLERWLDPVLGPYLFHASIGVAGEWALEVTDAVLAVVGVLVATRLWLRTWRRPELEPVLLQRGWFVDWAYDRFIARPSEALAGVTAVVVDNRLIDGAVNGVATLVRTSGTHLRKLQTGYVRNYALGFTAGVVVLLAYVLTRAGS